MSLVDTVAQVRGVKKPNVPLICLVVFFAAWAALAIKPRYPADWVLENLLTFVFVPAVVFSYGRFQFSDRAYVQMTIFLVLHTVGSHYTYSEVPVGDWLRDALGLSRNHYDRVIHFTFGLLMLRPIRELAMRRPQGMGPKALAFLSFASVTTFSLLYEVLEWIVAALADPVAGTAYLGTQGDVWDAQKDMALAGLGALSALFVAWRSESAWPPATQV